MPYVHFIKDISMQQHHIFMQRASHVVSAWQYSRGIHTIAELTGHTNMSPCLNRCLTIACMTSEILHLYSAPNTLIREKAAMLCHCHSEEFPFQTWDLCDTFAPHSVRANIIRGVSLNRVVPLISSAGLARIQCQLYILSYTQIANTFTLPDLRLAQLQRSLHLRDPFARLSC